MQPAVQPPGLVQDLLARPRTKIVAANGIQFTYREWGDPIAPLVLCLHGFPDNATTWDDLGPVLACAGYRVVAPWMRGYYPTSAPTDDDYSVSALGHDALALIAALGRDQAVLVGHDWGASAAYTAVQLGPTHVSRLVTVAIPHPAAIRPDALLKAWHFFTLPLPGAARCFVADDVHGVDTIVARWSPNWHGSVEALKPPFRVPGGAEHALGYYRSFYTHAPLAVGPISTPTLTIYGDADGAIGRAPYAAAAPYFRGPYKAVAFHGAGHFPQREQPERFAAEVKAFLKP